MNDPNALDPVTPPTQNPGELNKTVNDKSVETNPNEQAQDEQDYTLPVVDFVVNSDHSNENVIENIGLVRKLLIDDFTFPFNELNFNFNLENPIIDKEKESVYNKAKSLSSGNIFICPQIYINGVFIGGLEDKAIDYQLSKFESLAKQIKALGNEIRKKLPKKKNFIEPRDLNNNINNNNNNNNSNSDDNNNNINKDKAKDEKDKEKNNENEKEKKGLSENKKEIKNNNDNNRIDSNSPYWGSNLEIKEVNDKGRGYFAKKFLPAGTLFLCDHALVSQWYTRSYDEPTPLLSAISDLASALLSDSEYSTFVHSLSYAGSELDNFQGLHSNLKNVDDEEFRKTCAKVEMHGLIKKRGLNTFRVSVPLQVSIFNHSCWPNAALAPSENGRCVVAYAIQDIKPGDEVCVAYRYDLLYKPVSRRREELMKQFRFHCVCERCLHPERFEKDRLMSELAPNSTINDETAMKKNYKVITSYERQNVVHIKTIRGWVNWLLSTEKFFVRVNQAHWRATYIRSKIIPRSDQVVHCLDQAINNLKLDNENNTASTANNTNKFDNSNSNKNTKDNKGNLQSSSSSFSLNELESMKNTVRGIQCRSLIAQCQVYSFLLPPFHPHKVYKLQKLKNLGQHHKEYSLPSVPEVDGSFEKLYQMWNTANLMAQTEAHNRLTMDDDNETEGDDRGN